MTHKALVRDVLRSDRGHRSRLDGSQLPIRPRFCVEVALRAQLNIADIGSHMGFPGWPFRFRNGRADQKPVLHAQAAFFRRHSNHFFAGGPQRVVTVNVASASSSPSNHDALGVDLRHAPLRVNANRPALRSGTPSGSGEVLAWCKLKRRNDLGWPGCCSTRRGRSSAPPGWLWRINWNKRKVWMHLGQKSLEYRNHCFNRNRPAASRKITRPPLADDSPWETGQFEA